MSLLALGLALAATSCTGGSTPVNGSDSATRQIETQKASSNPSAPNARATKQPEPTLTARPHDEATASSGSTGSTSGAGMQRRRDHGHASSAPATAQPSHTTQPAVADLQLSSTICDISNGDVLTITKAQGWEDGPYTTRVTYSKTLDGPWTKYNNIDYPDNPDANANPYNGWKWPCHEPDGDDPVGYYTLWFTELGSPIRKSEYLTFQVVS